MAPHPHLPHASFDGGTLDCGNGLLLLIRKHIDPLHPGELLEILSAEPSVEEDLPAWCRLTGNELVGREERAERVSYLVSKGPYRSNRVAEAPRATPAELRPASHDASPVQAAVDLPAPAPAPAVEPLSVMGVGSWPRPRWLLRSLHDRLEGRLGEEEFQEIADDAVRLAVEAQLRAGVDLVTDGEQRRDNYSSFVGARLDNCQLIPITDLLPYVDDPGAFENELRSLDVPAEKVRHPAVFGPLGRSQPLALHELEFLRTLTDRPIKVALPGPYLLTRTMWMECISDRAYETRAELARDVVRVLREELHHLLAAGASLVQFDEPVLSEVVFGGTSDNVTFMCGALGERGTTEEELAFAQDLLAQLVEGLPRERLALHICRGNWTPDETAALAGDYGALIGFLQQAPVGTLVLELCTPRAGELDLLADLPPQQRIGVGVVNPKTDRAEEVDQLEARIRQALDLFGPDRILLNPDCGFATFADNPVSSAAIAERKLAAIVEARDRVR